jgi:cytochrome bd-type quinol oxidase subunit 1
MEVGISLVVFTLLYGALAVVEVGLIAKRVRGSLEVPDHSSAEASAPFAY